MQQCMELTRTNRSCGLTTYFFRTLSSKYARSIRTGRTDGSPSAPTRVPTFVSRRAGRRSKSSARYRLPTGGLLTGIWTLRYTICAHPSTLLIQAGHQASRTSHFAFFFLASIPERSHPFPSRTRKLSSPGPMVLQGQPCGRVGRCRGFEGSLARVGLLLFSARDLRAPRIARKPSRAMFVFGLRESFSSPLLPRSGL